MCGWINPLPKVERVQVVTVNSFPNVCSFINDGRPAVNSRTNEETTSWNVDSPRLFARLHVVVDGSWFCCYSWKENIGILLFKNAIFNTIRTKNWGIGFFWPLPAITNHFEQTVTFTGRLAPALEEFLFLKTTLRGPRGQLNKPKRTGTAKPLASGKPSTKALSYIQVAFVFTLWDTVMCRQAWGTQPREKEGLVGVYKLSVSPK